MVNPVKGFPIQKGFNQLLEPFLYLLKNKSSRHHCASTFSGNNMLKLETSTDLAKRLDLSTDPEILGFSLWYEKGEKKGFIHKFKFKFDTTNADRNSFAFSALKAPTAKTAPESYMYDLDTAIMIQGVFKWFTEVTPQLHYVYSVENKGKTQLGTALVQKILS